MATDLYLIRHGESVPNVEPIIGGMRGDPGLTDRGRRQAELLEARLTEERFAADVLYASTLPRAQETARYVARALGLPVRDDDELQELRSGEADGLSHDEWAARFPGLEQGPTTLPFQPFATGGESWAGFLTRAGAALTQLLVRHPDETVVAVCHGGVIEASFYLAFGLGATHNQVAFAPLNTCITHWRHDPAVDGRPVWRLMAFNDARHLEDTGTGAAAEPAVPKPADEEEGHEVEG